MVFYIKERRTLPLSVCAGVWKRIKKQPCGNLSNLLFTHSVQEKKIKQQKREEPK